MTISAADLRKDLSSITSRVAFGGERLVVERHGKPVVALVSMEDLQVIEAVEDLLDGQEAMAALTSGDLVHPWKGVSKP